ncbi:hypothetical protein Scep_021764 [Stephania cephalantha]|uniref:Uncharacterized protein n=1 Tax=Stephania cephalantha TaxID=152367 RepID=A0AAP0F415_9MAGN
MLFMWGKTHNRAHCPGKKPCFQCDDELVLKRVRNESPNKGRLFYHYLSSHCLVFL